MTSKTPTKANLIALKRSLSLAQSGYELLEKKRTILMRELLSMIDRVRDIRSRVLGAFEEGYLALQSANISLGQDSISRIIASSPQDDNIEIRYRSVMGVEIPEVYFSVSEKKEELPFYGLVTTSKELDDAYKKFTVIKNLTTELASIENSVYRLADAIKKSQKRANALNNIVIPELNENINYIKDYLDEKEREGFIAQKVIKRNKNK